MHARRQVNVIKSAAPGGAAAQPRAATGNQGAQAGNVAASTRSRYAPAHPGGGHAPVVLSQPAGTLRRSCTALGRDRLGPPKRTLELSPRLVDVSAYAIPCHSVPRVAGSRVVVQKAERLRFGDPGPETAVPPPPPTRASRLHQGQPAPSKRSLEVFCTCAPAVTASSTLASASGPDTVLQAYP